MISKFDKNSIKTSFATGIPKPMGLTFDGNGNLLATSNNTGSIYRITPAGEMSLFARTGERHSLGFICYNAKRQLFYITSYSGNCLYMLTTEGKFSGTIPNIPAPSGIALVKNNQVLVGLIKQNEISLVDLDKP
jgi:uncharacterized protein YjiK